MLLLRSWQKVIDNQYLHDFAVDHSRESKKPVGVPFGQRATLQTWFDCVLATLLSGGWQSGLERTLHQGTGLIVQTGNHEAKLTLFRAGGAHCAPPR